MNRSSVVRRNVSSLCACVLVNVRACVHAMLNTHTHTNNTHTHTHTHTHTQQHKTKTNKQTNKQCCAVKATCPTVRAKLKPVRLGANERGSERDRERESATLTTFATDRDQWPGQPLLPWPDKSGRIVKHTVRNVCAKTRATWCERARERESREREHFNMRNVNDLCH